MDKKLSFFAYFRLYKGLTLLLWSMSFSISNANPVQFWLTGEESFNQKEVCSIYPACFCQPFRCDDPLNFQVYDTNSSNGYFLKVLDKQGNDLIQTPSMPALGSWGNLGSGTSWNSTPSVTFTGAFTTSKLFGVAFSIVRGFNYTFSINLSISTTVQYFRVVSLDSSNNILQVFNEYLNSTVDTFSVTATVNAAKIAFIARADDAIPPNEVVTVNSFSLTDFNLAFLQTNYGSYQSHDVSTSLDSLGITCGQEIQFVINDGTNDRAFSDCIDFQSDQDCTELIQYSNSSNFAGLVFTSVSPSNYFYIRVPAVFFEEQFPQEQEDLELSDDTIITLWSKIEAKKTLDIGYMPFYMHMKLQMILMMDNVLIDGIPYRKRDEYQITPSSSKRSALRRASVILSQKDFIDRNLL